VLQHGTACRSVLQCVTVCCSVLQIYRGIWTSHVTHDSNRKTSQSKKVARFRFVENSNKKKENERVMTHICMSADVCHVYARAMTHICMRADMCHVYILDLHAF